MTDITEDDLRRAEGFCEVWERGESSLEAVFALALAETRERAEAPLRQAQILLDDAQKDHARIAELEDAEGIRWARMNARIAELDQEWEKSVQIAGAANAKVKKLEAENARLCEIVREMQRLEATS